jgi:hypothetical protein
MHCTSLRSSLRLPSVAAASAASNSALLTLDVTELSEEVEET